MPAFCDADPEPWIQPLDSSACIRLARIDLPEPGPPHRSKKNDTSCIGSNACMCSSSMSLTSRPAMFTPLEKRRIRKARWCPKGVRSVAMSDWLCAKPRLAVPTGAFGSSGSTMRPRPSAARRDAIVPASLTSAQRPTCPMS